MSYSIDANLLIYASDGSSPFQKKAAEFLQARAEDPDLLCMTWPVLMAYQRIATHPSIFPNPVSAEEAWDNVIRLLNLPRCRIIAEDVEFCSDYKTTTAGIVTRGNLVPDAHIATILRQHGVKRIYTADTDFRKFGFLEVINPLH